MICGQSLRFVHAVKTVRSDFFEGFIVRPATLNNCKWCPQACLDSSRRFFWRGNDTFAVAMRFAMKNGQICFSLRKFLAISSAIHKIASDCGCDAVVHFDCDELGH